MSELKDSQRQGTYGKHKRNPSLGYYMKNDYQQKKDPKDVNLSYSQNPNQPPRNQSIELAAKNGLNQSRSINPHQSILQYPPNQSPSHTNFRIGPLSNNVSRELSAGKKNQNISNMGNVSQDERSKNNTSAAQGGNLGQRRSSKIILSRNNSIKTGNGLDTPSQYPRILNNHGQSDYNLLGNTGREAPPVRTMSIDQKKSAHVEFKLPDPSAEQRTDDFAIRSKAVMASQLESVTRGDASPKAMSPKEKAVVHWSDCLGGQDIRTELKFGDCLGQGSFAKVYEGFDKRLKIPVAIKVIDKRKIKDTETKKKALIEEEIYIFSRLDHPNIVKFIRLIEDVKRVGVALPDLHRDGAVRLEHAEQLLPRPAEQAAAGRPVLQDIPADRQRRRVHAQHGIRPPRPEDDQHPHRQRPAGEDNRLRVFVFGQPHPQHVLRHAFLHAAGDRAERLVLRQAGRRLDDRLRALQAGHQRVSLRR